MRNKLTTFNIRMKGGYVRVCIFPTTREMWTVGDKKALEEFGERKSKKWFGRAFLYNHGREIACVFLSHKFMGAGTVSHEMTHVASHIVLWRRNFANRKTITVKITPQKEELMAETVDRLNRFFWWHYYKSKKRG